MLKCEWQRGLARGMMMAINHYADPDLVIFYTN